VALLAALHEGEAAAEVIDHLLVAVGVPPLGGEVVLAAGHDDPEAVGDAHRGVRGRRLPFGGGQVDVAVEAGDGDAQAEALFEVLGVAVEEVVGPLVALVDEGVVHVEGADAGVALAEPREVGVVLPEGVGGGADVGLEAGGVGGVQVADGGGQHDDVAGTLEGPQDQALGSAGVRHGHEGTLRTQVPQDAMKTAAGRLVGGDVNRPTIVRRRPNGSLPRRRPDMSPPAPGGGGRSTCEW
jgi:hypothetical protein